MLMNPVCEPQNYFSTLHEKLQTMEMTGPDGIRLSLAEGAAMALQELLDARKANRVVALVGNGGSAAIAAHMQIDLTNSLGVKSVIFSDTPTLTALSNDYGYAEVDHGQRE